ncbi:hypothetical protein CRSA0334_19585 [Cronobacter malonaticus ENBT0334]|nr:hypothetical protein CRSA0334_19585 [Cronobacter malonaticus ENBT0334]
MPLTCVYNDPHSYEPLARIDGTQAPDIYWFHNQPNGTPERLTDVEGRVRWEGRNSAWGKLAHESTPLPTGYHQNLRMQGQYLDRETGLHYNLFRYYDPDCGRFTQHDPIGLAGGINLYQFASNALGWVDPWGLTPTTLIHYTTEEGIKGIIESGVIRPSSGDIHARFGDGQYFTNITPKIIGGRTLKDVGGTGKMSLGQLAVDIYGDARKLKGVSHFVEIDVTGLDVIEPRKNTFLILNTQDLDVSKRIVKSGRGCD